MKTKIMGVMRVGATNSSGSYYSMSVDGRAYRAGPYLKNIIDPKVSLFLTLLHKKGERIVEDYTWPFGNIHETPIEDLINEN